MPRLLHVATVPLTLRFLRGQIQFMQRHGFDVHVAAAPTAELERFARAVGATPHGLPLTRAIDPRGDATALRRARRLIRRLRPDIVHGHTPKGGLVSMLAAASARVPRRIYHLRGMPLLTARGVTRAALWGAEAAAMRAAHRVIAVSPSLAAAARRLRLPVGSKLVVLGAGSSNGVDAARFDPAKTSRPAARRALGLPEDAVIVCFVGRLVGDKGIGELVEAWYGLRASRSAHLVVLGSYEERDPVGAELRARIEAHPTIHHFEFSDDVVTFYAASDVLALPTYREGFPNVPLEAAAMGLPVVTTTAVGAVDSVVDGVTGALVPVGDVAALRDALAAYVASDTLRAAHGRAGRARALKEFRPERIWRGVLDEYRAPG